MAGDETIVCRLSASFHSLHCEYMCVYVSLASVSRGVFVRAARGKPPVKFVFFVSGREKHTRGVVERRFKKTASFFRAGWMRALYVCFFRLILGLLYDCRKWI